MAHLLLLSIALGITLAVASKPGSPLTGEESVAPAADRPRTPRSNAARCSPLPEQRPTDLVIRYAVHHRDRPEARERFVLFDERKACPPDDLPRHQRTSYPPQVCVPMKGTDYDRLHARLRAAGIDRMHPRMMAPGPHKAAALLELRWGSKRCTIGDTLNLEEAVPQKQDALQGAIAAVATAIRAVLDNCPDAGATPPRPRP